MSSSYTLELSDDWDLHATESGNLPTDIKAQGIAQNVRETLDEAGGFGIPGLHDVVVDGVQCVEYEVCVDL